MSPVLLLILVSAVVVVGALIFGARRSRFAAAILLGFCLLFSAFTIFGFLASFEPMEAKTALIAKVSYVVLFLLSTAGIGWSGLKLLGRSSRRLAREQEL